MLLRRFDKLVEGVAVLLFAASSLFIFINVVNRYLILGAFRKLARDFEALQGSYLFFREIFGSVSVMADEVPGLLLVWIAFLGAYLAMRGQGHISFDLLAGKLNRLGQKSLTVLNTVLIVGFLGLLFWQSVRMISISGQTEIETAEIAQGWFMLILPLAALFLLIAVLKQLKDRLQDKDHVS
ncbi:MAG: TRAP transporter small permease [Sneathiella sp.]